MKNYSLAWTTGSTKQKSNNVVDHANSEQPKATMVCAGVDHAIATCSNEPVITYTPVAHSLSTLDNQTRDRSPENFYFCSMTF